MFVASSGLSGVMSSYRTRPKLTFGVLALAATLTVCTAVPTCWPDGPNDSPAGRLLNSSRYAPAAATVRVYDPVRSVVALPWSVLLPSKACTMTGTRDATGSQGWLRPFQPDSVTSDVWPAPELLASVGVVSKRPLALVSRNTVPEKVLAGTSRSSSRLRSSFEGCFEDFLRPEPFGPRPGLASGAISNLIGNNVENGDGCNRNVQCGPLISRVNRKGFDLSGLSDSFRLNCRKYRHITV